MAVHLFRFPKRASPNSFRWIPPSSLIASIQRKRSNPSNQPSTTWTSIIMGWTCLRPNLILPNPRYFRVLLPLPVTHGFAHQHLWASEIYQSHALSSINEHFYSRQFPVFHLLRKKADADAFSPFGVALVLWWNVPNSIASNIPFFVAKPLHSVWNLWVFFIQFLAIWLGSEHF